MIWEGGDLVEKGLAVTRMIHDRYHAARRNPWNEVECGDHYGRALASYGVFTAACGFEHHGPKQHIGFAPRLTPENFKCAFTSAAGWGSYFQKIVAAKMDAVIAMRWGKLHLKTISLAVADGSGYSTVKAVAGNKTIPAELKVVGQRALVTLADGIQLDAKTDLSVTLA